MEKSVERAQKMIHDLLGSGLLMKDVIAGSGVNPTTLGWIRKGRTEKISRNTYSKIKDFWTSQVYSGNVSLKSNGGTMKRHASSVPVLKGDRVDHAMQMVQQLVEKGMSVPRIYRDTGINSQTLNNLRNGTTRRVADRIYNRLRNYWRAEMNGKTAPGAESTSDGRSSEKSVETPQKAVTRKTTKTPSRRQKRPERTYEGFISRQHVPVDTAALTTVIDRLIDRFEAAKKELEGIRKEIG